MAGLLPGVGVSIAVSSDAPLLGPILGGQTGAGTGTPNTLSGGTKAQPTPSIQVTPTGSSPSLASSSKSTSSTAVAFASSSTPARQNTAKSSQTPSQRPTPSPSSVPLSSARPLTTFIISTVTNQSSTPTPSLSDPLPLPSPTSVPFAIPSSTPAVLTPLPTPSFIPPPPPPVIPESSLLPTPTPTPTPTPFPSGIAEPSQAETSGGGNGVKLMPALPIALGSVGGVLIFGLVIGMLYRKSKWPFHRRRNFAQIDELEVERQQELERQNKMKWDPRVTRTFRTQDAGVNF